ncbi:hypothetical protein HY949_05360 [Candidatus Gottesmanbacteria bacterium]|nr:hypothetical protein [Candidatus Gottesmanbacteria bacterium]
MKKIAGMLICFLIFLWGFPGSANATAQSYIRLSSMQPSEEIFGTMCHTPASSSALPVGIVSISFPSDFTIDSRPASWSTDTDKLPSSATAWPGIGKTADTVSGASVRFQSGALTNDAALYCFNFTSTSSRTSPSTGSKNISITTTTASGATLETKRMMLSIIKNDQITIAGTIKEHAADFPIAIAKDGPEGPVPQYTTIPFTITYGSDLAYAQTLRLEASWNAGEIDGSPGSTVDVLEYKDGSASPAFGRITPTVDLVNKKIVWTIASFPAKKKGQTVTFTLRTNALYTGKRNITSRVTATLYTDKTSVGASTPAIYRYNPSVLTSPLEPLIITVRSIASGSATLAIESMDETVVRVQYGTEQNALNKIIRTIQYARDHVVTLPNLTPDTSYFFIVTAFPNDGTSVTSDVYEFRTATRSYAPEIDTSSLMFSSADLIITPVYTRAGKSPAFSLPQGTPYNFRFKVNNADDIKRIQGIVRNKTVLGITSEEIIEPTSTDTTLFERQPGIFEGRLKSPQDTGTYEIVLNVSDYRGNVAEQTIAEVYVAKRLTIKNKTTEKPVEGAQILILYRNPRTRIFDPIPESVIPVKNPSYTDINGQIPYPLPQGTYKAKITAIGYRGQEVDFTIGQNPGEDYPEVSLVPEPFALPTIARYYWTILLDVVSSSRSYIQKLSRSVRFFELNTLIALTLFVYLTLLSFSSRIRIPLHSLIEYFLHRTKIATIHKKLGERIKGRIFDEKTGDILSSADVFLIDSEKNKIVGHTTTNHKGDFSFLKYAGRSYELEVMKGGYEPIIFHESDIHAVELGGYLLSIHKRDLGPGIREKTAVVTEKIASLLFEALLVGSVISETSLGFALGWQKTVPFLLISLINLGLWILHLTHLRSEKNIF